MNKTGFLVLSGLTVALIAGAVLLRPETTATAPSAGARFFPALDAKAVNAIDRLRIVAGGERFTLERRDGGWTAREKGGYPVAFARVKETLVALSRLQRFERKTRDPARYGKLELEDPAGKDARSKRLTAFAGGKTVADVIVGKSNSRELLFGRSLVYVRLPADEQSWLAVGDPKPAAEIGDWLDRSLMDVGTDRIRQVVQTGPAGKDGDGSVIVGRDRAGDAEFALRNKPEGREVKGERFLRYIAESLDKLTLEDVRPAAGADSAAKAAGRAEFRTFDGLTVTARLIRGDGDDDDEYWMTFAAAVDEAALLKKAPGKDSKLKPADAVRKEAEAINARTGGWAYKVSGTVTRFMRYTMDDLLKPLPKEKPAEGASGDAPAGKAE